MSRSIRELTSEETLQLARYSLDHAEEGVLWTDAEGTLLYANPAAGRKLGREPADLLGSTLFAVSPEMTPELWRQLWKEIKTRDVFAFEFTLRGNESRVLPVEMNVHAMTLGDREILCAWFRDVNEKKRLQQLKDEFVSTVSHELRTPMTIIRESVSQILDGLCGEVPHSQREALFVTLTGIDRLARIINDLLDVSKMDAGKATLRWERVNIVKLALGVVETFAAHARERGLALRAATPSSAVWVYADYDRIVQVFTNLVGNALKFSENGTVEISACEKGDTIECSVSDNGIGIAQEDLGKMFNKFEQLSRPAVTGEKGSGLGLSICKGIVEMHQGRITVESRPGHGTTFTFSLPKRTAKDVFRQKISAELAQAASAGGNLSAVRFAVEATPQSPARTLEWAVDELMETIKVNGARKTDILLKDSDAVWLGLLNTTQKEAIRIIDRITEAFLLALDKQGMGERVRLSMKRCSYPEEVKTENHFLQTVLGEAPDA